MAGRANRSAERRSSAPLSELSEVLCWTRMQSEAGQQIDAIVMRKELERLAGDGLFCWGIGSPPPRSLRTFAIRGEPVDVVFSLMKSRPKITDVAPKGLMIWRRYVDFGGAEQALPPNTLITSSLKNGNRAHYALMCCSEDKLELRKNRPFDPSAYVNVSEAARPVGASQVTALVRRVRPEKSVADYHVNLKAILARSYWVKLTDPVELTASMRGKLEGSLAAAGEMSPADWLKFSIAMRGERQKKRRKAVEQLTLFER